MNAKLEDIMSEYAELWADVLYNRKLEIHLKKIKHDITYIKLFLLLAYLTNNESVALIKIKEQLLTMSFIIKKRISEESEKDQHVSKDGLSH